MPQIRSVAIPQPCSQSWQQMEIRENGRHCAHCAKIVVDFSKMTNDEIVAYLTGAKKVCGRFDEGQLAALNNCLKQENVTHLFTWSRLMLAAGLIGLFNNVGAQKSHPDKAIITQQQVDTVKAVHLLGKVATAETPRHRKRSNGPKKENVRRLGLSHRSRNADGLKAYRSDVESAHVFRIVPDTQEHLLIANDSWQELQGMAGGVYVVRSPFPVRLYYRLIKWPLQRLFR